MKTKATYSVIVPLNFQDRVQRAKQILRETSSGNVLVYLMDQFEKAYQEEVANYDKLFLTPKKEIIMEKGPEPAPLF
jgi:hypothetical protein